MPVQIYKSTDASAPVLSGTVGSLVALLDACLVNGYGAKAAAGWTKPFSGTNKAVYRMTTTGATGFYLNVDDSAPNTAKDARVRGYEVMTAQDTGTSLFPTTGQMASGVFVRKSFSADATARPWVLLADATVLYLFTETGDFGGVERALSSFWFGDFFSYKSGDAYNCGIAGRSIENSPYQYDVLPDLAGSYTGGTASLAGSGLIVNLAYQFVARNFTGVGGSTIIGKHGDSAKFNGFAMGYSSSTPSYVLPYPNPTDNGLYLSPVYITEGAGGALRGYLKGFWNPCHAQPMNHLDAFTGSGAYSSKSFLTIGLYTAQAYTISGRAMIETSDTWS